jgi:hypothetical protein
MAYSNINGCFVWFLGVLDGNQNDYGVMSDSTSKFESLESNDYGVTRKLGLTYDTRKHGQRSGDTMEQII